MSSESGKKFLSEFLKWRSGYVNPLHEEIKGILPMDDYPSGVVYHFNLKNTMNSKTFDIVLKFESEAREFADSYTVGSYEPKIWENVYRNKFAELIIRECISVLNHRTSVGKPDVVLDEEVHSCIRDIKEHFGVE